MGFSSTKKVRSAEWIMVFPSQAIVTPVAYLRLGHACLSTWLMHLHSPTIPLSLVTKPQKCDGNVFAHIEFQIVYPNMFDTFGIWPAQKHVIHTHARGYRLLSTDKLWSRSNTVDASILWIHRMWDELYFIFHFLASQSDNQLRFLHRRRCHRRCRQIPWTFSFRPWMPRKQTVCVRVACETKRHRKWENKRRRRRRHIE